jgi:uncharacterized protein (DUF1697 family)
MALVVFLRGVNVGGHKTFRPAALARDLDLVNVGAAGTFVARRPIGQAALRAAILERLPFAAEVMIVTAREIQDLVRDAPSAGRAAGKGTTAYVSVMAKRPGTSPRLPIRQPAGDGWQVQVFRVSGRFALSEHRRVGRAFIYPNEVVEKTLGVPATTRNWSTMLSVQGILDGPSS